MRCQKSYCFPGEQTWVNLGDLIRHQIADKNGRVIPPGVIEGSYEIKDLDAKGAGYLYEGKTITDKTFGHATYGCAECCMQTGPGYDAFDILDDPANGTVGGSYLFYAAAIDACSGLYGDVAASDWSSSDTAVGTIDYSGNMSFVGAGTTTVRASSRLSSVNNCCGRPQTFFASATATVQVPTYFGPTGADPTDGGCATGSGGQFYTVHNQVLDQNGSVMNVKGLSPQEHVIVDGTAQPGYHAFATPDPTLSDGKFDDDPVGTCWGPPKPPDNPCRSVTVSYQAVYKGVTYPIQTTVSRRDCNNGVQVTISGNPAAYNKTFSQGTIN